VAFLGTSGKVNARRMAADQFLHHEPERISDEVDTLPAPERTLALNAWFEFMILIVRCGRRAVSSGVSLWGRASARHHPLRLRHPFVLTDG
jgi:hypothetical protein